MDFLVIGKWKQGVCLERYIPNNSISCDHILEGQSKSNKNSQAGKQEAAEELCKKCLKYNKECSKAWELLGLIMEKNHSYPEAVSFYEKAWKCLKEASPAVGYRLAYTFLKDKRHIEAITVCLKVLQISPNYPKIKKDILDKARLCVRA